MSLENDHTVITLLAVLRKLIFMMRSILLFIIFFQSIFPVAVSQKLRKADKEIVAELQTDISYLSNDKLEGRRSGTPGEKLASDYIVAGFIKTGLKPLGTVARFSSVLKFMMAGTSVFAVLQSAIKPFY